MIYSARIGYGISLLGEAILREGFFDGDGMMPRKPKRPCRMTGCPNLTDRKSCYCEAHEKVMQRHYDHFTRGYDQHERYGSTWKRIRDRHLAGHPLCEMCKEQGRYVLASLVHHIRPISDGGTHEESNLMSLCVSCHERIHQRKKPS